VQGRNISIDYRWADGDWERLGTYAAELVRMAPDVLFAAATPALAALHQQTRSLPIVFVQVSDPVKLGLVASLARPGGNLTGFSLLVVELHAKRLELISEVIPSAKVIALLVNPDSPQTERVVRAMQEAAGVKGVKLEVLKAATESAIDTAFTSLARVQAGALVQGADPFFLSRRDQLALLAARHAIPAIYESRPFVEAGGLMSYGANFSDMYRQIGAYAGRILKGEKPADLPVMRPTKLDLAINLTAARAIGLTIPESFLLRADQVIE
jgi:putative tryptophan/tyrosine transport system substrate-binding protein